ncbi:hypothetical protein Sme01_03020 [Sphaerisporangium melleum]|uniref:Uncharacterized protein n=1 Tax=Sphaerisporangium melleum TaxID=321316 RepID=A0A917QPY5_9ACTN|nr:hypothetical protein [Sphaerisporangium melleum]GGK61326.1 hypothetical protein GCM10007964_00560 [Sphaerisporangium melleum]GII67826.1 hypothetical protein Sme01_03020 [Sphaerisporangium melleum]
MGRHSMGWKEDLHPRDHDGKFTSGSGGSGRAPSTPAYTSTYDRAGNAIKPGTRIKIAKGKNKGQTATVTAIVQQYPVAKIDVDIDGKGRATLYARDTNLDKGSDAKAALPANVARRSQGEVLRPDDGYSFPQAVTSAEIPLDDGSTLTLHKSNGDAIHVGNGTNASALTIDEIEEIESSINNAHHGGLDIGESEDIVDMDGGAFGRVTKTGRNQYQVDIDGRQSLTLTPKQADQMESEAQRIQSARRIQTAYGPADVYLTPGGKLGLRASGGYGEYVDVELSPSQARKLSDAITATYDGFDPNGELNNEDGSRIDQVDVPLGKGQSIHVEQQGPTPGENGGPQGDLLLEAGDGSWSITADPNSYDDLTDAIRDVNDML